VGVDGGGVEGEGILGLNNGVLKEQLHLWFGKGRIVV
jgi:hypothetical protein